MTVYLANGNWQALDLVSGAPGKSAAARALAGRRRPHREPQASVEVFFQTLMAKQSTPIPTTIEAMPSAGSTA